jgi:dihydrofolate synthase / folylpolyglutamate synthase
MTYQQTIDFLFTSLPMFQRIGNAAIKKDLTNIRKLSSLLGDPHLCFHSIHVAGTNGKGSTSHMLASIFQAAGKRTGLYTSPHYVDFRERIKVNGKMIDKKEVIRFVEENKSSLEQIRPSFFEITVAMAFDHFCKEKVEIAIIETGLGGRLDSTNIITPLISVITNIGFDHMQMLGETLPEIAAEKAGIIKKNVPVVIGEWQKETSVVFKEKAQQLNAPITFASKKAVVEKTKGNQVVSKIKIKTKCGDTTRWIKSDLAGPYQKKNILTVLETCNVWNDFYPASNLSDKVIRDGIRNVRLYTNMIGRWMVINEKPLVITDAAHNIDGIKSILPQILTIKARVKHFVLGFVSDKDVRKILTLFPEDGHYYWCSPDIPRGKPVEDTFNEGRLLGLEGKGYKSVALAYRAALAKAEPGDLIFIGGSSYVVGDFLAKHKIQAKGQV